MSVWSLRKALGLPWEPPKLKPYEIAPGCPRPSYTLAVMICQRWLVQPELWVKDEVACDNKEWTWASDNLVVKMLRTGGERHYNVIREWTFQINGEVFEFTEGPELKLFLDTLNKCIKLIVAKNMAIAKHEKEEKACNLIQSFFNSEPSSDNPFKIEE